MLKSYLKTALRFLWKQRAYSFINVVGLAAGLACSFFILLWVQDELRYDRFHERGDRLFRVMRHANFSGQLYTWPSMPKKLHEVLAADFPEIERTTLLSWDQEQVVARGDRAFREQGFYTTPAFLQMFSFPLVLGDAKTALDDPGSVVISAELAAKYFGDDWQAAGRTLGQTLRFNNEAEFTVSGVFTDVPRHSTLQFDFLLPFEAFARENPWVEHWGNNSFRTYVQLAEGADAVAVDGKVREVLNDHWEGAEATLFLQPYGDVRLHARFEDGRLVGGRIEYVRIFGVVAAFILLIASINFMNLATARSGQRAREIGVRKSVGATRGSLVRQFLGESVLLALLALAVALGLVALGLPAFNALTEKAVGFADAGAAMLVGFAAMALGTGLLAGSYPALYLSSFDVIAVLRSTFRHGRRTVGLRRGLVVFQFALSILLIVGTLTVYRQIDFIRSKNLGLDRENLISLPLEGAIAERFEAFRQELLQRPGIASVTTSSQNPLSVGNSTSDPAWEGAPPDHRQLFHIINANYDFVETMKMELVDGRAFSRAFATDSVNYLVNEEAARVMGMEQPVGQQLTFWGRSGEIVGVVKDFHMTSLYEPIEPTIIRFSPGETWMLFVRTRPGETEAALASLEAAYEAFNPAYPFQYEFLDESFERTYRSETVIGTLARIFALLAIFIACLGLFGLASFTAEQRTKEVGIRKVMGASVANLVLLLSRDFVGLVLVAFALAAPVAFYVMRGWLDGFAYHVDVEAAVFAVAGVAAVVIAFATVGYQALRAAVADPVKSLRTE